MDIYQIWITHNRPWSEKEIVFCLTILLLCAFCVIKAACTHKIKIRQAAALILLIVYLEIVFGSTVFTRTPTVRRYELVPLWSWAEVLVHHSRDLLIENLLNCVLLFPVGLLLPVIFDSGIRPSRALLLGCIISASIELCQLIFWRGLFEWDDMLHNGIGCALGCLVMNVLIKYWRGRKKHPDG